MQIHVLKDPPPPQKKQNKKKTKQTYKNVSDAIPLIMKEWKGICQN